MITGKESQVGAPVARSAFKRPEAGRPEQAEVRGTSFPEWSAINQQVTRLTSIQQNGSSMNNTV